MQRQATIDRCKFDLATNFDCPSEQILGVYGAKLGLTSRQMYDLLTADSAPCQWCNGTRQIITPTPFGDEVTPCPDCTAMERNWSA